MSDLMKTRIEVPCPQCGRKMRVTLRDVKSERTVHCPGGHSVKLVDQNDGVRKIDQQFDDFQRQLRRLGR